MKGDKLKVGLLAWSGHEAMPAKVRDALRAWTDARCALEEAAEGGDSEDVAAALADLTRADQVLLDHAVVWMAEEGGGLS